MEKYNKYHEALNIDCCDKDINKPKVKNNCCCDGINLPSHNNEIEVLIRQLKREVKELLQSTQAKLLCQDKKIAETMVYIKNNLSNAIRDLLDSMLTSGELEDIITDTVLDTINELESDVEHLKNSVRYYNTVSDLISGDVKKGEVIKTLGYYSINDGGEAYYQIRQRKDTDIEDSAFIIFVGELTAELLPDNNVVNIRQLGARSQDTNNNKYDIASYITKYMVWNKKITNRLRLYIPSGIWYCSGVELTNTDGFDIYGDFGFSHQWYANSTIITSLTENQNYILQIGSTANTVENYSLKNIIFSTADFTYNQTRGGFTYGGIKNINNQCVKLIYATQGTMDNIFFTYINGQAMKITSSWENYFKLLNFRNINASNNSILCFGTADSTLNSEANITACNFEKLMFESTCGDLIMMENNCKLNNCHFGTINFEDYKITRDGISYTTFSSSNIPSFNENTAIHDGIFNIKGFVGFVVESIELNNFSFRYRTYNSNNYVYDTIFNITNDNFALNTIVNNIHVIGMNKNARILKQNGSIPNRQTRFVLNNVNNCSNYDFYYDVDGYTSIINNAILSGINLSGNDFKLYNESDCIPFYKSVRQFSNPNSLGFLYYDSEANNPSKLVVKPYKDSVSTACINTVLGSRDILVRAKIPNGVTYPLAIISENNVANTSNLVGTGSFKNYLISLPDTYNIGDIIVIRGGSASTNLDCYLDYYKFY